MTATISKAPLAYLITWTTYRSWLPGDSRGWIDHSSGAAILKQGDAGRYNFEEHHRKNIEPAILSLDLNERGTIAQTIRDHCAFRNWQLHALNVRSNHIHLVVTTTTTKTTANRTMHPQKAMGEFKAWCSRRLNEENERGHLPARKHWWTYKGSTRWINDEQHLRNAINYVMNCQ